MNFLIPKTKPTEAELQKLRTDLIRCSRTFLWGTTILCRIGVHDFSNTVSESPIWEEADGLHAINLRVSSCCHCGKVQGSHLGSLE